MQWVYAAAGIAVTMALDWIARGLDNNSISSRLVIILFFSICVAQAIFITLKWKCFGQKSNKNKEDNKQISQQTQANKSVTGQERRTQANNGRNENNNDGSHKRMDAVAVFTCVLAVVATIQAAAFVQSERAALSVSGFRFWKGLNANEPLVFFFDIKNSGKSQAVVTDVRMNWQIGIGEGSPDRTFSGETTDIGITTDVPSGTQVIEKFYARDSMGKRAILQQPVVDKIKSGELKLAVYGAVDFSDNFFIPKTTEFCYIYDPEFSDDKGKTTFYSCPSIRQTRKK